jgi:hypothetical protein
MYSFITLLITAAGGAAMISYFRPPRRPSPSCWRWCWRRCSGWVNQCRAWLQSRSAPPLLQPYYMLHKLFNKDVVLAHARVVAVPRRALRRVRLHGAGLRHHSHLSTDLPLAPAADALALVGVFGLARVFISLAAMDVGTSFGTLGGRREMLVGFLAEPALLMVLFTAGDDRQVDLAGHHRRDAGASRTGDLSQPGLRRRRLHHGFAGRKRPRAGGQPGHPPRTDHDPRGDDPRIFGPPPGADRVGRQPQAVAYSCLGLALFFPWGIAEATLPGLLLAMPAAAAQAGHRRLPAGRHRDAQRQDAHLPRAGIPRHRLLLAVLGLLVHLLLEADDDGLLGQLINLFAAAILLLAFAMLAQRRMLSLINLFAAAGRDAGAGDAGGGYVTTHQPHLYCRPG